MKPSTLITALCAATLALGATSSRAAGIADAAGDFLPSYTGAKNGDLDVLGASVTYNAGNDTFFFSGTFAAPVGTTPTGFYVWGLDRGTGAERFNSGALPIGAGVLFDSVVILRLDGSITVNRFDGSAASVLGGAASFAGSTITGSVSGALLPSNGFAKADYTWNLWPRDGAALGNANAQVSDFAPDASNAPVIAVPEPQTWALLVVGLAEVAAAARRARTA